VPTIVKPEIPDAPNFSPRRLREARHRAGLTLAQVGNRLGRRWTTVIRYERGEAMPSVVVLGALAHILGVGVGDLFEVDPPASALDATE
jgi:transcriptional regulator with XRE-family HTH domain